MNTGCGALCACRPVAGSCRVTRFLLALLALLAAAATAAHAQGGAAAGGAAAGGEDTAERVHALPSSWSANGSASRYFCIRACVLMATACVNRIAP